MTAPGSLHRELTAFGQQAGPELVPVGALAPCAPALAMFAAARPELVLELHVGAPRPVVDLTVRVFRRDAALLDPASADLPDRVCRVLRAWRDPASAFARVPFVELEFDLESEPALPWIGPAVEPELRRGPAWIQDARDQGASYTGPAPADAPFVTRLLRELGHVETATEDKVARFVDALPRWGILSQMALLAGRPSSPREGVRVFVSVPVDRLEETLANGGWTGDARRVRAVRERFVPGSPWIDVDFGISASHADPAIGFYREFRAPRLADSSVRDVLDAIGSLSLTSPARLAALRAWIACNDGRLDRMISFKVAILPDSLRLKVYLSVLGSGRAHDGLTSRRLGEITPA